MQISFTVCSHNGANRLPTVLRALAGQRDLDPDCFEIIVVDNASTDGTFELVSAFFKESPVSGQVVQESTPGLSAARMAGFRIARGRLIIMVDDDNVLDSTYGATACQLALQYPAAAVFGGLNQAVSEVPLPDWFSEYQHCFACGPLAAEASADLTETKGYVFGAGMVIRSEAIKRLLSAGWAPTVSDRSQSRLTSGGDVEICSAIRMLGYRIRYDDRLRLEHHMAPSRLHTDYLVRLYEGFYSSPELGLYNSAVNEESDHSLDQRSFLIDWFLYLKMLLMYRRAKHRHPHLAAERATWLGAARARLTRRRGLSGRLRYTLSAIARIRDEITKSASSVHH